MTAAADEMQARTYEGPWFATSGGVVTRPWPGIGSWFWTGEEFEPDGYKRFIDLHAQHSGYRLVTTSIRHPVEITDPKVHDQFKAAAEYARARGMDLVLDFDIRLARQAFAERHPGELQEIVRLRETPLEGAGETVLTVESLPLGDHYTFRARGYDTVSERVLAAYSYMTGPGGIRPDTVLDITGRCRVVDGTAKGIQVAVQGSEDDDGRTVCVLAAFGLFVPDVFGAHVAEFEREIMRQYADVPLAGGCKDEWGFPGRGEPRTDDLWYSGAMAEAYAKRRPGHDLTRDLLLMSRGEIGRERERTAAINHYMELFWQRNGEVESSFYASVKEVFGPEAVVATHATWYPTICAKEVFKNGLDWWVAKRDLAQTDESTPFAVRTALAKKWGSPVWYNQYYDPTVAAYEQDLWRHALGGGRMNFHPLFPHPWEKFTTSLLSSRLLEADCRVRLLNYVSKTPIDCPVAVVFGHPRALNWTTEGLGDGGLEITNALWERGYYADLIPSSEIASGALHIADDGRVAYGVQRYGAAILYRPQFERPDVAVFMRKAAEAGATVLYRVGDWTLGFEGEPYDGNGALPEAMQAWDPATCTVRVVEALSRSGIEPQTTCTMRGSEIFPASMMPRRSGQCRLIDGTVILASGEQDVMGDPIRQTITVRGRPVSFDAVGVAAVRLDERDEVEAVAGGALKSFHGPNLAIELANPIDLALWRDSTGHWRGVIQGWEGPIPEALGRITSDWTRLFVPTAPR